MLDLILIADDLTGAADTGAPFAVHGLPTRLIIDRSDRPEPGITALSTESRDLNEPAAITAVRDAWSWAVRHGAGDALLFKKIDSTLRGHVVAELSVLIEQAGIERILLSPAFPAQGRTTRGGRHLVHGTSLGESSFGIEHDELCSLFDGAGGLPAVHHPREVVDAGADQLASRMQSPGIHIPDIETDEDMDRCVQQALAAGITRFCGAGGLGRALAVRLRSAGAHHHPPLPVAGPVLFVAGSRNQATLGQVAAIADAGVPVVSLPGDENDAAEAVAGHLRRGTSVVLSSSGGDVSREDPRAIRDAVACTVARVLASVRPGLMLMTGGDIAAAICRELGVTAIELCGEVEPGIPHGRLESGAVPGLPVVTKAGGFGSSGTFARLLGSACGQ